MGEIKCAKLLKNAGADLDVHGKSGQSMLVFAVKGVVRTGDIEVLNLALSWGLNPNVLDANGSAYSPLHEAAWQMPGHDARPIIVELLRSGADPCIVNKHGATAWDIAHMVTGSLATIPGQTKAKITSGLERSAAVEKLLADAMTACPPTATGPYYERPA